MAHLLLIWCRSVIHDHANQIDLLLPWSWAFVFQKSDAVPDGAAEALFFHPEIRLEGNTMYRTLTSRASLAEPQELRGTFSGLSVPELAMVTAMAVA